MELLTDYDMLLIIESRIRGGICQSKHRCTEANNKYMKNYNKNIPSSYLMYLDANNLYGWTMCKKLPVDGLKWIDNFRSRCRVSKNTMGSSQRLTIFT